MNAILTTQDHTGATRVAITNPFGYYRFLNLSTGHAYTVSARAKGWVYSDRIITVNDDVVNFDFLAEEK